jgi:hemerythrin-like domain-containing protein
MTENENKAVNHPSHYNATSIEVIDVIEDWDLNFHLGNALKYVAKAGLKDRSKEVEDLEKAIFYLERYLDNYHGPIDRIIYYNYDLNDVLKEWIYLTYYKQQVVSYIYKRQPKEALKHLKNAIKNLIEIESRNDD